jgi:hypothetical protein
MYAASVLVALNSRRQNNRGGALPSSGETPSQSDKNGIPLKARNGNALGNQSVHVRIEENIEVDDAPDSYADFNQMDGKDRYATKVHFNGSAEDGASLEEKAEMRAY